VAGRETDGTRPEGSIQRANLGDGAIILNKHHSFAFENPLEVFARMLLDLIDGSFHRVEFSTDVREPLAASTPGAWPPKLLQRANSERDLRPSLGKLRLTDDHSAACGLSHAAARRAASRDARRLGRRAKRTAARRLLRRVMPPIATAIARLALLEEGPPH